MGSAQHNRAGLIMEAVEAAVPVGIAAMGVMAD